MNRYKHADPKVEGKLIHTRRFYCLSVLISEIQKLTVSYVKYTNYFMYYLLS